VPGKNSLQRIDHRPRLTVIGPREKFFCRTGPQFAAGHLTLSRQFHLRWQLGSVLINYAKRMTHAI
jgi:hypothetical protein